MLIILGYTLLLGALLSPDRARAEFYSYEDSNGTINFVDDLAKIPKKYRGQKQVRKDADDDLSVQERALLREKEHLEPGLRGNNAPPSSRSSRGAASWKRPGKGCARN